MKSAEIFTWVFSPQDSFEEAFTIVTDDCALHVGLGSARAEIDSDVYRADPAMVDRIQKVLKDHLTAAELVSAFSTTLNRPERETLREDGKRVLYADIMSFASATSFVRADVVERDPAGNVVRDTRQERIDGIKRLGARIAARSRGDSTLVKLIASFRAAMRDPSDELVHLYEIADALKSRFKRRKEEQTIRGLCEQIGLESADFGQFERLCNQRELRQGRHRGLATCVLRAATPDELHEARSLAAKMIGGYLGYLERANRG